MKGERQKFVAFADASVKKAFEKLKKGKFDDREMPFPQKNAPRPEAVGGLIEAVEPARLARGERERGCLLFFF